MAIGGKITENQGGDFDNSKYVGLFLAKIIAINPTVEQFKDKLGIELKEDSKATDYLGESKDGNTSLRIDFWLEDKKDGHRFKKSFFLEDKVKENKDATKKQYINSAGVCSWSEDGKKFPDFFKKRSFREANVGEEKLYNFIKTWLGALDLRDEDSTLELDWKKLMKGNVKELKDQIGGEYCTDFIALATIKTVEKTDEETGEMTIKTFQSIYDGTLPGYLLPKFSNSDYDNAKVLDGLNKKVKLEYFEKFIVQLTGEYGTKEFFKLKPLAEYNPDDNIANSSNTIKEEYDEENADY